MWNQRRNPEETLTQALSIRMCPGEMVFDSNLEELVKVDHVDKGQKGLPDKGKNIPSALFGTLRELPVD